MAEKLSENMSKLIHRMGQERDDIEMPKFNWDVTDFISCLEVLPEVEEYEVSHSFVVEKHGMRLLLKVEQDAGDVYFNLYQDGVELPVFSMKLRECQGARYINDKRGEYLEFAPSKCFGTRYDGYDVIPYGVRLYVKPSISIEMY